MEIRVMAAPWHNGVEFLIEEKRPNGDIAVVKNLTMEPITPGMYQEPTGRITKQAAQVLMDDLWAAGLRPSEGSGSAGSLRATERHLEDMRSIVSKKLDVPLGVKP